MAQGRSAWGHESKGKKCGSITYSMDREDEVSEMLYLYCVPDGFRNDFCQRRMASNFIRNSKAEQVNLQLFISHNYTLIHYLE